MVENRDTFEAAMRVLGENPGHIGMVGFGAGAIFPASVGSLDDTRVTDIQYFGDLDTVGLQIPIHADKAARALGLPAVRPAVSLYEALLKHGRPQPGGHPVAPETATLLASWLAPQHRVDVENLLCSGYILAQEGIDASYLFSRSEWRRE